MELQKQKLNHYGKKTRLCLMCILLFVFIVSMGSVSYAEEAKAENSNYSITLDGKYVFESAKNKWYTLSQKTSSISGPMISFDVNDNRDIVILFEYGNVLAFDKNMKQIGSFRAEGATFVKWEGEDIFVLDAINQHGILVNKKGILKESVEASKEYESMEYRLYTRNVTHWVGEDCYRLCNSSKGKPYPFGVEIGAGNGYSYLVEVKSNGEANVLYSVRLQHLVKKTLIWLFCIYIIFVSSTKIYFHITYEEDIPIKTIIKIILRTICEKCKNIHL